MSVLDYLGNQQILTDLNENPSAITLRRPTTMVERLRSMEASQSDAVAREITAFSQHLNVTLSSYDDLSAYLPLNEENLFERLRDGLVLGHLLHHYFPGSIRLEGLIRGLDLTQINQVHTKAIFEVNANLNLIVKAAKTLPNLVIVNLGAEDILHCNRDLVLGLLWQIFNTKLASSINLQAHPELVRLVEANESLATLAQLRSDALLNRWLNFHLKRAGATRRAANLSKDLADSELYMLLMHQIAPRKVSHEDVDQVLQMAGDSLENKICRAEKVLECAERLGCREFLSPYDLAIGHPRLNFAFTATLFNKHIGISLPSEEDVNLLKEKLQDATDEAAELKARLQAAEFELGSTAARFKEEVAELRGRLDQATLATAQQLEQEIQKHEAAKEELAAQYRDSLESALESEKRSHQDEVWDLLDKEKERKQRLLLILLALCQNLSQEDLEREKVPLLPSDAELAESDMDGVIKVLEGLVGCASKKIKGLQSVAESLKSTVAHKEKVNEIMGEKIKEYTEQVIHVKRGEVGRRTSILKRIFSKEK